MKRNYFDRTKAIYNLKKESVHFDSIDTHAFALQVTAVYPEIRITTAGRYLRQLRAADRQAAKLEARQQ